MPEPKDRCPLFAFSKLLRGLRQAVLGAGIRSVTAPDFTTATHMAAYTEWNLSSLVASGARFAIIRVKIKDDTAGSYYAIRRKGDSKAIAEVYCQAAGIWNCMLIPVQLDANGIFEHRVVDAAGSPSAVTQLSVAVLGSI